MTGSGTAGQEKHGGKGSMKRRSGAEDRTWTLDSDLDSNPDLVNS